MILKECPGKWTSDTEGNIDGDLFMAAPFGYVFIDPGGKILKVNRMAADWFGRSRRKLAGSNFADMIAPEHRGRFESHLRLALDSERCQTVELDLKGPEGQRHFIRVQSVVSRNSDGREIGLLSAFVDITAHKDTAAALSVERNNLTNILNSMEDGICIVNERNDITFVNPALEKHFGSIDGRKCYDYFHSRTSVCPWCKNTEVMAGRSVRWEWHSEKTRKTFDLLDTPLRSVDGGLLKLEIL